MQRHVSSFGLLAESVAKPVGWSCLPKPATSNQGNRALDPTIRPFNTYRRLIRAQVPARLDRLVAEIPEKCESERYLRFKLTVVCEGFFDVIDEEKLNALDPTDEEDVQRIEALHERLRGELRP